MSMTTNTGIQQRAVVPTLVAGLRWLFDTEQPAGAVLQHHGLSLPGVANRRFNFCPAGWEGHAIVTVDVVDAEWKFTSRHEIPTNSLRPGELDDLTVLLNELGVDVLHTWNGHPGITGSLALGRPAHPSLLAAVNRYLAGCLTHPDQGVFCKCGWYAKGYNLAVLPELRVESAMADEEPA
ncbi:MAG: hypothetical protein J2P17_33755 [Mycobacterium sp.]|nr:hypothetical protein [Mycobacterium sp.]